LYSRYLWEKHHGAIAEGMLVMFVDKNSQNCVLENLCLRSMQDCMQQNHINQLPEDIRGAIHALGGFKRRIKTKIKHGTKQNQ
jgi:HNH endonuclease